MAAATSLTFTLPKPSTLSFQNLLFHHRAVFSPILLSSSTHLSKTLDFISNTPQTIHTCTRFRRFSTRAESTNGAEPKHYDFDLFTIGAGSGGVRASRFAANFGASVAVCELPFATISSETTGGVGGT